MEKLKPFFRQRIIQIDDDDDEQNDEDEDNDSFFTNDGDYNDWANFLDVNGFEGDLPEMELSDDNDSESSDNVSICIISINYLNCGFNAVKNTIYIYYDILLKNILIKKSIRIELSLLIPQFLKMP